MGILKWSDLARLMALTSATWAIWAGMWAIAYRKFFWDFIGAQLGPAGLIPASQAAPFVSIIVTWPLVQIFVILFGVITYLLEWGFPFMVETGAGRSIHLRIVLYTLFAALEILLYQGFDGAVYYLLTVAMYCRALWLGETLGSRMASSPGSTRIGDEKATTVRKDVV